MNNRLPSKHIVKLLNMKTLTKEVMLILTGEGYELNGNKRIETFAPLGVVTDISGKHYLIDTEGYGEEPSIEDNKAHISWYEKTIDKDGNTISFNIYPFLETLFSLDELSPHLNGEKINLDKFVRLGGGRLDRNVANWDKFLSGELIRVKE